VPDELALNRFPLFGLFAYRAARLNHLFDLYKAWRDENKVGFNRVDLVRLVDWLHERSADGRLAD
jgi:hypothetical protein